MERERIHPEDQIRDTMGMIGRYCQRPLGGAGLAGSAISQIAPTGIKLRYMCLFNNRIAKCY